jgi:anti-sigma B factor antagonist
LAVLSLVQIRRTLVTGGVAVVSVGGEIDLVTVKTLRDNLSPYLADPATMLVVCDLSQVKFLACSGLSVLLDTQETLNARGARLAVVANNPAVLRPLTVTGLSDILDVSPTVTAALA